MSTELLTGIPARHAERGPAMPAERIVGLRCRNCSRPETLGPNYVCAACFGPLEVAYDLELIAGLLDRATIAARPAGIWRYLELLPVQRAADPRAPGRLDPADRRRPARAEPRDRPALAQGRHP